MIFYQVENGQVVGNMFGTDIPGDPSCTRAALEVWAAQKPGRLVITDQPLKEVKEPEFLKVTGGKIQEMDPLEKEAVVLAREEKNRKQVQDRESALAKLADAAGLTPDEKNALKIKR